jgi:hypothetical protein
MGFRRSKNTATERQRWQAFLRKYGDSLSATGMPEHLYREKSGLDHWLMHGQHPMDPSRFAIEQMNTEARKALVRVIAAYFDAGFADPGITVLSADEMRQAGK